MSDDSQKKLLFEAQHRVAQLIALSEERIDPKSRQPYGYVDRNFVLGRLTDLPIFPAVNHEGNMVWQSGEPQERHIRAIRLRELAMAHFNVEMDRPNADREFWNVRMGLNPNGEGFALSQKLARDTPWCHGFLTPHVQECLGVPKQRFESVRISFDR